VFYYTVRIGGDEMAEWPLGIHFLIREMPAGGA
jgi:hypothetical protein